MSCAECQKYPILFTMILLQWERAVPRRAGDDSVPDANASRSLRIEAPCLRAELYNEFYGLVLIEGSE